MNDGIVVFVKFVISLILTMWLLYILLLITSLFGEFNNVLMIGWIIFMVFCYVGFFFWFFISWSFKWTDTDKFFGTFNF
jgi:hypothetical protein